MAGCRHESCAWRWSDLREKYDPAASRSTNEREHLDDGAELHPRTLAIVESALDATDLDSLPEPEPLLAGILNRAEYVMFSGKFGTYKSFLCLAWGFCIATGQPWCGYQVPEPLPVVYVAAEGISGYRKRLRALERHYGLTVPKGMLTVIPGPCAWPTRRR
jgi:hypothetical protein